MSNFLDDLTFKDIKIIFGTPRDLEMVEDDGLSIKDNVAIET